MRKRLHVTGWAILLDRGRFVLAELALGGRASRSTTAPATSPGGATPCTPPPPDPHHRATPRSAASLWSPTVTSLPRSWRHRTALWSALAIHTLAACDAPEQASLRG